MKKRIAATALAALIALASTTGCQSGGGDEEVTQEPSGEEVVATLQEYTVTLDDYTFYYRWMQDQMEYQAMYAGYDESNMDEFWNLDQGTGPMKNMIAQEALTMGKQYAVLHKMATDEGIALDEAAEQEVQTEVANLLKDAEDDEAKFEETYGFSSDLMRRMYIKLEVVNQYLDKMKAGITVDAAEVQADYQKVEDERAEAKAKADDLLSQIEAGTPIGDLVAENTDDTASIETEGEYTFGKGEMVAPFEEWAFAAEPGDKGVVETDYGYHVMELIEKLEYDSEKDTYAKVTVRHILIGCTESTTQEAIETSVRDTKLNAMVEELLAPVSAEEWVIDQALLDTLKVVDESAPIGSVTGDEIPKEISQSSETESSPS